MLNFIIVLVARPLHAAGGAPSFIPVACIDDLTNASAALSHTDQSHLLTETNLRRVLQGDGFTQMEIEDIILDGKDSAALLRGKPLHVAGSNLRADIMGVSRGIGPETAVQVWPFLKLLEPDLNVDALLIQALIIGAEANHLVLSPLARWARFLPLDLRRDSKFRSLVLRVFENEHLGLTVEKLMDAFGLRFEELNSAAVTKSFWRASLPSGSVRSAKIIPFWTAVAMSAPKQWALVTTVNSSTRTPEQNSRYVLSSSLTTSRTACSRTSRASRVSSGPTRGPSTMVRAGDTRRSKAQTAADM